MAYREKIDFYLPEHIKTILDNDALLFEIYKNKTYEAAINRNRFLSLLIVGYYDSYSKNQQANFQKIEKILEDYIKRGESCYSAAEKIINAIDPDPVKKRKGEKKKKISVKPTSATEGIINEIKNNNDNLSEYLRNMTISYCNLPLYERERIIFKENYETILEACRNHQPISFSTTWNDKTRHQVIPYKLAIGQDEMFNYLLCQEKFENGDVARSYHLNRIINISLATTPLQLSKEVKNHLDITNLAGAQFAVNDDEEICVRLTERGTKLYKRIYRGRPEYKKIEYKPHSDDYYYYFQCSEDQLFFYFNRFGGDTAEIIYPKRLRDRLIQFHKNALVNYKD